MYTQPGCEYGLFYRKGRSHFRTGSREIVLFCIRKFNLKKGESDCSEIKMYKNLIFYFYIFVTECGLDVQE